VVTVVIDQQNFTRRSCHFAMILKTAIDTFEFLQCANNSNITNICRCGTYARIRKAIHKAAELQAEGVDNAS
jgi:aerobic-type carbon monoxide dehydrogenase small subunit (CoxS/CutS family)